MLKNYYFRRQLSLSMPPIRLNASLVALSILLSTSGCGIKSSVNGVENTAESAVQQATLGLSGAIDALQTSSSDWQQVLKDMESKLSDDARNLIQNSIANVVSRTVAQAGVELRCDADFINKRVAEDLIAIKASLLGETVPPVQPTFCSVVPEAVDRAAVPQDVKLVSFYGYNFDHAEQLRVKLMKSDGSFTDVTNSVNHPTTYAMTLSFGANGVQLDNNSQRFVLEWAGQDVSSVGIIQPQASPPVCDSKVVSIFKAESQQDVGPYVPPKIRKGDDDFDGNGPDMHASVSLSVSPQQLTARVYLDAIETKADWTEVQGWQDYILYKPDEGYRIDHVDGPTSSSSHYLDKNSNKSGPSVPFLTNMGPGDLVERYGFIGDTDGKDVGRTSVSIHFNPVTVTVVPTTNCVSASAYKSIIANQMISGRTKSSVAESVTKELAAKHEIAERLRMKTL